MPSDGFATIIPTLRYHDARAAIEWFGSEPEEGKVLSRNPDGTVLVLAVPGLLPQALLEKRCGAAHRFPG